jgi:hypothetical protein
MRQNIQTKNEYPMVYWFRAAIFRNVLLMMQKLQLKFKYQQNKKREWV